jgi:CBS domain-containing protein
MPLNVAAILKQKGRAITTARPTVTLMEVANKLAAKRIGAIVFVGAGGEVAGAISERDIIRALSKQRPDCLTRHSTSTLWHRTCEPSSTPCCGH